MGFFSSRFRYLAQTVEYSLIVSSQSYEKGQIAYRQIGGALWKNFYHEKLTFIEWSVGEHMMPAIGPDLDTLLVRKLPIVDPKHVFVGDVVLLTDPEKKDDYLVRRLAAMEGAEMVSTDEKDEPFVLEKDEFWVLADNEKMKVKEAYDSRTFGPVHMTDIVGRVIYRFRSGVIHGPVQNSPESMDRDAPVLAVELDVVKLRRTFRPKPKTKP